MAITFLFEEFEWLLSCITILHEEKERKRILLCKHREWV